MIKNKIYTADKVSGFEGSAFLTSICVNSIIYYNESNRFKFPFWGGMLQGKNHLFSEWIHEPKYRKASKDIFDYISKKQGLNYFEKFKEKMTVITKEFENYSQKLREQISNLDDYKLVNKYEEFVIKYQKVFAPGIITFLYEGILSEKLMKSLLAKNKSSVNSLEELLSSKYKSFMIKSEEALLKIKLEKNKKKKEKLINFYLNKFFYIEANYNKAPIINKEYVLDRARKAKKNCGNKAKKAKVDLLSWEKQIIELLKITEVIRDKRKHINLIGSYMMDRFLDEVITRKKINSTIAKKAFWHEYRDLMFNTDKTKAKLEKRNNISFVFNGRNAMHLNYCALKSRVGKINNFKELLGTPASSGNFVGVIRKIMSRKDFSKMKKDDVLLTTMTRPEFVPIMKKAGAIITEEGGLTCHAAIIAREMKIPCIVDIKNITEILKDDDQVEVNANKGIIKIIN